MGFDEELKKQKIRKIGTVINSDMNEDGVGLLTVRILPDTKIDFTKFTKSAFYTNILKSHDEIVDGKTVQIVDEFELECMTVDME